MSDANHRTFDLESLKWPTLLKKPSELLSDLKKKTGTSLINAPISSKIVLQIVGGCAYILCHYLNHLHVFNKKTFDRELRLIECNNNPGDQHGDQELGCEEENGQSLSKRIKSPLITYSNHISCLDDPMLWACLFPWNYYTTQTDSVRWSAAAIDICFTNSLHSAFFSLGKTFPVVRGVGLQQPGMDFATGILGHNQWLHLFPEGRVMRDRNQNILSNRERGYNFKWGIAKLIMNYLDVRNEEKIKSDQNKTIRILPFYHLGLDKIFPVGGSYVPKIGQRITILIRPSTIKLNHEQLINIIKNRSFNSSIWKSKTDDQLKLIKLTNFLEQELEQLKEPTYSLHSSVPNETM